MQTQNKIKVDRQLNNLVDSMSAATRKRLEHCLKNRPDLSVMAICKEFGINKDHTIALCERFGVDPAERKSAWHKHKSLQEIERLVDFGEFKAAIDKGTATVAELTERYNLSRKQCDVVLEIVGYTRSQAALKYESFMRSGTRDRDVPCWMFEDSLSKDGMSLEWLSKRW